MPPSTICSVPVMNRASSLARYKHRARRVPAVAHEAEWNARLALGQQCVDITARALLRQACFDHRRVKLSRHDAVDPDTRGRVLDRDHARDLDDGGLGRGVRHLRTASPARPEVEEMLTIEPAPFASIVGRTCLQVRTRSGGWCRPADPMSLQVSSTGPPAADSSTLTTRMSMVPYSVQARGRHVRHSPRRS